MRNKIILFLVMWALSVPPFFYRFNHPEKTETELFLDFFKVYKEFFLWGCTAVVE